MVKKEPKIPELRFPEFEGEWENKKLGQISTFLDSRRIPLSETERKKKQGKFPYYGASGIIDYIDDFIFDSEFVLLGEDGANIVTRSTRLAFVVKGKVWVNNHAHVIEAKESTNFLAESLERIRYEKYNTGTAQPKLNAEVCKKIRLNIPTLPEQQKIAAFLTAVDDKIQQLTRKKVLMEDYKKGVMQQIFSQQIRFKTDDGSEFPDWEEKRLGKLTVKVGKKNKESIAYPIYSINNVNGFLPQADQFEGMDSNSRGYDISMYKIIKKNTFAYNPSRINVGSIGFSGELENIIISSLYVCFQTTPELEDSYLLQYVRTFAFNKSVLRNVEGGVRDYLFYENFSNINIPLPSNEEQQKIADFLSVLDTKITQVNTQLEQTKTFKKGLLQKMFV